jgi:predicted transcriptional regulator YdeE
MLRLTAGLLFSLATVTPISREAPVRNVQQDSFYVAGYSVRTNNAKEMSGHGSIGPLWQRWFAENLAANIPNRADNHVIAVYSDYATDEKGDYTYTLGTRVSSIDHLPSGITSRTIAPGPYAVFTTETGPVTQVVPAAWQRIWATPPDQLGGKRAFLTDYEVYDRRSADPGNAQVDIHIGLQPH